MEKIIQRMRKSNLTIGIMTTSLLATIILFSFVNNKKLNETIEKQRQVNNELKYEIKSLNEDITKKGKIINEKQKVIDNYENQIMELKRENMNLKEEVKENQIKVKELENKIKEQTAWKDYIMTHYTAFCDTGCIGTTKTGIDVSDKIYHKGRRIIAVDPRHIPLGSIVEINDNGNTFIAQALDTGGDIKGNRIDLLVKTNQKAIKEGVKHIKVRIIRKGWEG
jgi:3D (Asp-Asp-Asp) domain-containing protein